MLIATSFGLEILVPRKRLKWDCNGMLQCVQQRLLDASMSQAEYAMLLHSFNYFSGCAAPFARVGVFPPSSSFYNAMLPS